MLDHTVHLTVAPTPFNKINWEYFTIPSYNSWLGRLCFIETDHPSNAKPIDKTSKIIAPEHIFHRHLYTTPLRKSVEQPIGFLSTLRA